MSTGTASPVGENYYLLLGVRPKATVQEVEIAFRRYVARYRPTLNIEQLFADRRFKVYLNAYLTLRGPRRADYDAHLAKPAATRPAPPTPFDDLDPLEQRLTMARVALWRREHIEGIHLLRALMEAHPDYAPGWALLGEFFFTTGRLTEGVHFYEKAVQANPEQAGYAARLREAKHAVERQIELEVETSPEEELLAIERHRRRAITASVLLLGLAILASGFILPAHPNHTALFVPWDTVAILAAGMAVVFFALAFGRVIPSFESVMLWSSIAAGDRGRVRNYPYGLLLFVTAVPSLWLSVITLFVMAFMDEEWPLAPSLLVGLALVINLLLTLRMFLLMHDHWTGTLMMGGNALLILGMLGWWIGSLGSPAAD